MNGFTIWFDLDFKGTQEIFNFDTSSASETSFYQVNCFLQQPIGVNINQVNKKYSTENNWRTDNESQ